MKGMNVTETKSRAPRNSRLIGPAEATDKLDAILSSVDDRVSSAQSRAAINERLAIQIEIGRVMARVAPSNIPKVEKLLESMGSVLGSFELVPPPGLEPVHDTDMLPDRVPGAVMDSEFWDPGVDGDERTATIPPGPIEAEPADEHEVLTEPEAASEPAPTDVTRPAWLDEPARISSAIEIDHTTGKTRRV
jgi:hypothetical protein